MCMPDKPKLALILGSGFSKAAGLPVASKLNDELLEPPPADKTVLTPEIDNFITDKLREFWRYAFGYEDNHQKPTLEEHFTTIDLAANTGHCLGEHYEPKKLRAIRRFSIHRVFERLDLPRGRNDNIGSLLLQLKNNFHIDIITLNWDIVVEKCLFAIQMLPEIEKDYTFDYGIEIEDFVSKEVLPQRDLSILKAHGSANWVYCNNCRRIFTAKPGVGKVPLERRVLINKEDFELLGAPEGMPESLEAIKQSSPADCPYCHNGLSTRIGTFSFRKDLSLSQFGTIWEKTHRRLSEADHWLFIGYSLPEADYEFKHLLKSAQLAKRNGIAFTITTVCGTKQKTQVRYKRFFGETTDTQPIYFDQWFRDDFHQYLERIADRK